MGPIDPPGLNGTEVGEWMKQKVKEQNGMVVHLRRVNPWEVAIKVTARPRESGKQESTRVYKRRKAGLTSTRKSNWWTDRTSPQRLTRYRKGVKVESMRL